MPESVASSLAIVGTIAHLYGQPPRHLTEGEEVVLLVRARVQPVTLRSGHLGPVRRQKVRLLEAFEPGDLVDADALFSRLRAEARDALVGRLRAEP